MTVRVDTLTPVLDAAPGELVVGRVRVVNDGPDQASFRLRVVGLDGNGVLLEVPGGPIGPGMTADVDVPLDVPFALGVGHHAVALEVSSDRPDDRPALAQLTISIDSLERVQLAPRPSTVRSGRNGRFTLDVVNHEPTTVDVTLAGEAADVAVRFSPPTLRLHPGQRGWVRARLRARQRWGGESVHHVVTLTARGRSSTSSTTMAFIQRPVIPWRARNAVAALVVLALFLGAIGGSLWWLNQRDARDTTEQAGRTGDADGDGVLDPIDGVGTSGGTGGAGGSGGANGAGAADSASGPGAIPTYTVVTGNVTTTDGDSSNVSVSMAPIDLNVAEGEAGESTIVGVAGRSRAVGKLWSARRAVRPSAITPVRQTEAVDPVVTDGEGVWQFAGVPIRQNYEVVFAKPGYNTRSYVVTPPDDGSRVELDVELEPATGRLAGVVVGPDGPLGGVDIEITDGTLVFSTTSASEASAAGGVGSFAVERLSTPGVYTITATAAGFGTEVIQLPFTAGQERDVTITMSSGVGSISGRITTGGEPRGGVTITASNGDATVTTTSLTEGDVGSYNIPRLGIPGTYTVTAELAGFIPQTRRVEVRGAVSGVDYQLVPTTASISGRVFSSNGNPIVGAGITVSVDEISFQSTTARDPVPGTFDIDDLPPGTYLVRIARFDHLPFTQQVTVAAGQTVDLGDIVLEFSARPPIAALGSISVRVEDSEGGPLTNATVEIYPIDAEVGVDEPLRTATDTSGDQFTFVFDNIPVGTYRVMATRSIYRPTSDRVSVGLGRSQVSLRMLRLGQASGQLVDAFTGAPLRNYEVSIYRIDGPGAEVFVESRPVLPTAVPTDGRITWQSSPNSLIEGLYRIEVTRPPPGYALLPDQVVDPTVTTTPASMRFIVPVDSEEPVVVGDIEMVLYPIVSGRIFAPQLSGGGDTSLVAMADEVVEDLDELEVRLTCGESTAIADIVPLGDPGAVQPSPGFELPGERDYHFEFTPFVMQQERLLGQCELTVTAAGYVPSVVALTGEVAVSDGATLTDRAVNVAVFQPVDEFFGSVFWRDLGRCDVGDEPGCIVPLGGVQIQSDALTLVGARATQATGSTIVIGPSTGPPQTTRRSLSTTSDDAGDWQLDGQIFGRSIYTFTHPDFATEEIEVTLDDAGSDVPVRTVTQREVQLVPRADDGYDIELTGPNPGPLGGTVRIRTTKPAPAFGDVGRQATGPGPTLGVNDLVYVDGGNPRTFRADEVNAGTWSVTYTVPDNHELIAASPSSQLVRPQRGNVDDAGNFEFDVELVELATVDLEIDYQTTDGLDPPTDTPQYELTGPGFSDAGNEPGGQEFVGLPVDSTDPEINALGYSLDVSRVGFDEASATVVVNDLTSGTAVPVTPAPGSSLGIPLSILAGTDLSVDVTLPQYGTLTGTVLGVIEPTDTDGATLVYGPGELDLTAVRIDGAGNPIVGDDITIAAAPVGSGASFVVSGPPGRYRIDDVSHPSYEDFTPPEISGDGIFEMANAQARVIDDPWKLGVKRGFIDLTVARQLDDSGGAPVGPVGGAVVFVSPSSGGQTNTYFTDVDGHVNIDNLVPGSYRVEIREYSDVTCLDEPDPDPDPDPDVGCEDIGFPVIVHVDVPSGDEVADRTTTVTAALPSLLASIVGTVTAVNSDGDDVAVPQSVTVNREFLPPAVQVAEGGLELVDEDNEATDADAGIATTAVAARDADSPFESTFLFERLPIGAHDLTVVPVAGYSLDTDLADPVNVADHGGTEVALQFSASDVTLAVTLQYEAVPATEQSPTVRLREPGDPEDPDDPGELIGTFVEGGDGVFRLMGVVPRPGPYWLTVDDPIAQPVDEDGDPIVGPIDVVVVPNGDGVAVYENQPVQALTVRLLASGARVSGLVQQLNGPGPAASLRGPATIVVTNPDGDRFVHSLAPSETLTGTYTIVVPDLVDGVHTVTVEKTADGPDARQYYSTTATVTPVAGEDNTVTTLVVRRSALVRVTLGNASADTDLVAFPVDSDGNTIGSSISGTRDPDVDRWEFEFDPTPTPVPHAFRASTPGYYDVLFPAYTPVVGGNHDLSATLTTRMVAVDVSGAVPDPEDDEADPVEVTAAVTFGGDTYAQTLTADDEGDVSFTFPEVGDGLPLTGAGTLTVTAPGYRSQTFAIDDVDIDDGDPPTVGPGVTQADLTDTFAVALAPAVTTIQGEVTGTDEVVEVTLTGPGGAVTANSTGVDDDNEENTYSFTSAGFAPGTYVARVDVHGIGSGEVEFQITDVVPSTHEVDLPDLAVTARDVTISIQVGNVPETGASIHEGDGATSIATTSGDPPTATFTRSETVLAGGSPAYTVRAAGRIWVANLTFDVDDIVAASDDPDSLSASRAVTLVNFPSFGGNVTVTVTVTVDEEEEEVDVGISGVPVTLHAGSCPASGLPTGTALGTATTVGDPLGAYSGLTITAGAHGGSFCLSASDGDDSATRTLTIPGASTTQHLHLS